MRTPRVTPLVEILILCAAIVPIGLVAIALVGTYEDPPRLDRLDLQAFHLAAQRIVAGTLPYGDTSHPFVHPPSALVLFAPLGLVSFDVAHALLGILSVLATFTAAWLVVTSASPPELARRPWPLLLFLLPGLGATVFVGQLAGLYLLALALVVSGVSFALPSTPRVALGLFVLFTKPPLALFAIALVLARRAHRPLLVALAATVATTTLAIAWLSPSSPLAPFVAWRDAAMLWIEWLEAHPALFWRQHSLYGALRAIGLSLATARALATLVIALLGVATVALSRRAGASRRVLVVHALALVAGTQYLFFYDGLLALVPLLLVVTLEVPADRAVLRLDRASLALLVLAQVGSAVSLVVQSGVPSFGCFTTAAWLTSLASLSRTLGAQAVARTR